MKKLQKQCLNTKRKYFPIKVKRKGVFKLYELNLREGGTLKLKIKKKPDDDEKKLRRILYSISRER